MSQDVLVDAHDGVATLTLHRPERLNALSPDLLVQLRAALERCATESSIRAVILTGAGRGFCAGGDVKRMDAGAVGADAPDAIPVLRAKMDVVRVLYDLPKPTIAMINGPAAGAGLSFALACDLRIAAASARFTTAFANVGLPGDFGGSYLLTQVVGTARAREMYFSADRIDATQALAWGLVHRVIADADVATATMRLAHELAAGAPLALRGCKRNLARTGGATLCDLLDLEARHQIAASLTDDHREATRAFIEKRAPVFRGS